MDNLINVFMNYKVNRLVQYGVFLLNQDTPFLRKVLKHYFQTYVDNYYYHVFHTIDDDRFNEKNLKLEFTGAKEEMLDDYREYELQVSNEEYAENQAIIRDMKKIAFDICKIDTLKIEEKSQINEVLMEFIKAHDNLQELLGSRLTKLGSMIRETITTCEKMIHYEDNYYILGEKKFEGENAIFQFELIPNIKVLEVYKKGMITKIYQDHRLDEKKMECFLQKVSLFLLKKLLAKEKMDTYILPMDSPFISRGRIDPKVYSLMDNPLFRRHVVIGVPYNTYLAQKTAFAEDFTFACIQDFSHINDIYQKVINIYQEGVFQYLIVSDYRYKDKDFFLNYDHDVLKVLVFEEE